MSHAIIWCRVSTIKQEYESQKKELIKTALKDGFQEQDLIIIGEAGASAIKMNDLYQKEVNKLLETIDNIKSISCVYVWEVSRLARNKVAFQQMTAKLISNKIQLKCNVPQLKLLDDNGEVNNGMELTFDLLITLAKQEMDIKMRRFARGKEQKAIEGKFSGGNIPFGYRIDKERDNLIVVDDNDSKIVKEIFDLYERGLSQPKLAKEMHDTGRGYVTISMINNILNNASYCGIKKKSPCASYERVYPPIISKEQYTKCREIADTNNTTLSKAKNIYFAEHLVKCPTCGAYWSASGGKASYHCPVAYKSNSIWKYDNHYKEKCSNKTSFSINILDSILWHVAIEKEACYIEQASEEKINKHIEEAKTIQAKIDNIQPRLEELAAKKERLLDAYVEGMKKEKYEKKRQEIEEKIREVKSEQISFKDELKHVNETIQNLKDIRLSKPVPIQDVKDFFEGEKASFATKYPFEHAERVFSISLITDDSERKKIVQRQIKSVEVIPTTIRFPFGIGVKESKARKVIVHSYIPSFYQKEFGSGEGIDIFYAIGQNGKGLPRILDINPDEYEEGIDPTFYSYLDKMEYYFTDIAEEIYMLRYRDVPKRSNRDIKLEKKRELIGDKLSLTEASEKYGITYNTLWNRINMGVIPSEFISNMHYVNPKDVEEMIKLESEEHNKIDGRMTILAISKKLNVAYSNLRVRAIRHDFPCEIIEGKWYAYLEDVRKYYDKTKG